MKRLANALTAVHGTYPTMSALPAILGLAAILWGLLLCGCADISSASRKTDITLQQGGEVVTLASDVNLSLPFGISAEALQRGSKWKLIGTIDSGRVYSAVDGVFVVADSDHHEAYLVVDQNNIVGIYSPFNSAFVSCKPVSPFNVER